MPKPKPQPVQAPIPKTKEITPSQFYSDEDSNYHNEVEVKLVESTTGSSDLKSRRKKKKGKKPDLNEFVRNQISPEKEDEEDD